MDIDEAVASLLEECHNNAVNVDILTGYNDSNEFQFGLRFRPWKNPGQGEMILVAGRSIEEALTRGIKLAQAGRWETLSWSKRPWKVASKAGTWT